MKKNFTAEDLRCMRYFGRKTTKQMASKIKVTRNTYENWEKGIGQPKITQFLTLCIYCGINISALIDQIKSMSNSMSKLMEKGDENNDKRNNVQC